MSNPEARRTANRSALIAIGLTLFYIAVALIGDWDGMEGLALGLLLYFIAIAHIPLGLVALISALRAGDHRSNSWIYAYFGVFSALAVYYVGAQMDLDKVIVAGWERFSDAETVELREASGGYKMDANRAIEAIAQGGDVNSRDERGRTPLMLAANESNLTIVNALLDAGAEPNATANDGGTPLHYAAAGGTYRYSDPPGFNVNTDIVSRLLAEGAEAGVTNNNGYTPLMAACRAGSKEAVTLLLQAGADIGAVSERDDTCPRLASRQDHTDFILWLIDNAGVDPRPALAQAASRKHVELFKTLLERGTDTSALIGKIYRLADDSRKGNKEILALLIETGRGKDALVDEGHAEIWQAATRGGTAQTIRNLIALGVNPEARGTYNETVLHFLARQQPTEHTLEKLRVLLEDGAGADVGDHKGEPPLFDAVSSGNLETVQLLIEYGADVNATSNSGKNVLAVVAGSGYGYVIDVLIEAGLEIPQRETHGDYLVGARSQGTSMRALLKLGLDPNVPDYRGILPLYDAINYGDPDAVRALLEASVDLTQEDNSQYSPLTAAANRDRNEAMAVLLEAGIDPTVADRKRRTAMGIAVKRRNVPMIIALMNEGVRPNKMELKSINDRILSTNYKGRYKEERERLRGLVRYN